MRRWPWRVFTIFSALSLLLLAAAVVTCIYCNGEPVFLATSPAPARAHCTRVTADWDVGRLLIGYGTAAGVSLGPRARLWALEWTDYQWWEYGVTGHWRVGRGDLVILPFWLIFLVLAPLPGLWCMRMSQRTLPQPSASKRRWFNIFCLASLVLCLVAGGVWVWSLHHSYDSWDRYDWTFRPSWSTRWGQGSDAEIYSDHYQYFWYVPFWKPTLLFGAAPALWLWSAWRRRSPYKIGFCRRCGYNLTGNLSGVCPECGTPIADAKP